NVDWALSRARYWGTPLPLWRCEAGHVTAVESLADLSARAGRDLSRLDPHRPFVDAVTFACPVCGAQGRRVPDVLDAWFDSGAMPFSQWGYPHTGRADFESSFPADFISEAIDQTRGWFYSLLAVSILLFDRKPYQHVVCLGLLVDGEGRKMSKSLGNALDPFPLLERYGADPLRWFMLANGSPWASRRLSPIALEEITRSFLLTLWNAYAFFSLYAQLDGFDPTSSATMNSESTPLDRWALGRLAETVGGVTADLDAYDPSGAARKLTELVDDLSNWYVRLSRRRFWRGTGPDSAAAFRTLWKCLRTLTLMLAPFIPFLAEELWQGLVVGVEEDAPDSVHLAGWPEAESADLDTGLLAAMVHARRLVKLGRQARTEAGVKVRQPLARALVTVEPQRRGQLELLLDLVATELNVKEVAFPDDDTNLTDFRLIPNFRTLGPRFGRDVQAVASAVRAVPPAETDMLAPILLVGKGIELNVPGLGSVALGPDEVGVAEEPIVGWRVVRDGTASVALDLRVTPELRREGLARDLVRAVQEMRKTVGLAVEDRIELAIKAEGEMSGALAVHRDYLMAETLATVLHAAPQVGGHETQVELEGQPVHLWLRRLQ
ncbi:MAG: class I tRNA ligase family protein, partial [Actinomycetota bacterium]